MPQGLRRRHRPQERGCRGEALRIRADFGPRSTPGAPQRRRVRIEGPSMDAATRARRRASRSRAAGAVWVALLAIAAALAGPMLVAAQTAEDPSNVVLVFDVSNSILLSDDGTNTEFAEALDDIADRVDANAEELAIGNA